MDITATTRTTPATPAYATTAGPSAAAAILAGRIARHDRGILLQARKDLEAVMAAYEAAVKAADNRPLDSNIQEVTRTGDLLEAAMAAVAAAKAAAAASAVAATAATAERMRADAALREAIDELMADD